MSQFECTQSLKILFENDAKYTKVTISLHSNVQSKINNLDT